MRDAEDLRKWATAVIDCALKGDQSFSVNMTRLWVPAGAGTFIHAIQGEIFERFGWRTAPPDVTGWWTLWRVHPGWHIGFNLRPRMTTHWYDAENSLFTPEWRQAQGDLWRLMSTTREPRGE